jgi:sRNA-binding carbon storage regulator CsrA
MLILQRKPGERINVYYRGERILEILNRDHKTRLGFVAGADVNIVRDEIDKHEDIQKSVTEQP